MTKSNQIIYNLIIIVVLFASVTTIKGQSTKRPFILPFGSMEYTYQQTHNFGVSIGAWKLFKRHTYIALVGGPILYRNNNVTYVSPNLSFEWFYQFNSKKAMLGPMCRINYTSYKIQGQIDKYISGDIGFRIFAPVIYVGYNYNLDKKEINQIAPIRVGIKYP